MTDLLESAAASDCSCRSTVPVEVQDRGQEVSHCWKESAHGTGKKTRSITPLWRPKSLAPMLVSFYDMHDYIVQEELYITGLSL